jgi:cytoskeletal protein CcmA (bactofilin family)
MHMTHIGQFFVFRGELSSNEDLRFDGTLKGHLDLDGATLILGETATVDGDIRAQQVIVQGTVRGSITAVDRIELSVTAKVNGTLTAERLLMADGSTFNGDVYMGRRTIARRVAQYRASQTARHP